MQMPDNDPVRQRFVEMYEENLVAETESRSPANKDEERQMRVDAMAMTALQVRKDLDNEFAAKMKSLEMKKDMTQFLLAEYKLFGFVPEKQAGQVFAEYLLMTLLDEFEAEDRIDFSYLGDALDAACKAAPAEYQKSVPELKRVFKWGSLIDA